METVNQLEPSLNTWTILFIVAAGQGIFLASLFFLKRPTAKGLSIDAQKKEQQAKMLLGLFVLFFSLTLIDYVGFWTNYNVYVPHFANFWQLYVFLFGPLLFLYLKTTKLDQSLGFKDTWHFVPALLFVLYKMPYFLLSANSKTNFLVGIYDEEFKVAAKILPNIYFYFKWLVLVHLSGYAFAMGYLIFYKKEKNNQLGNLRWHQILWGLYLGFVLSYWLYYGLVGMGWLTPTYDYVISFAMTIFIYTVGYMGYQRIEKVVPISIEKEEIKEKPKYQNSTLTEAAAQSLLSQLTECMETEKPYMDSDIRLAKLAAQINSTPHHLSQVINEQLGKSFSDFINEYRIKAAQEMLLDPQNKSVYIINIAYTVGFNNKTSFNKAFKQMTGMSPSAFRKGAVV